MRPTKKTIRLLMERVHAEGAYLVTDPKLIEELSKQYGSRAFYDKEYGSIVVNAAQHTLPQWAFAVLHELGHHIMFRDRDPFQELVAYYKERTMVGIPVPFYELKMAELDTEYRAWDLGLEILLELNQQGANLDPEAFKSYGDRLFGTYTHYWNFMTNDCEKKGLNPETAWIRDK